MSMSTRLHGSVTINISLYDQCRTTPILYPSHLKSPVNLVCRPISIKWNRTCLKSRSVAGRGCSWSFSTPKASSRCEDSPTTQKLSIPSQPRPLANFPPDIWGDRFLDYTPEDDYIMRAHKEEEMEELKKWVRRKLLAAPTTIATEHLNLIDNIQRLSLGYHFEKEIEDTLQHVYKTSCDQDRHDNDDLYTISLRFRLLRQQGIDSSSDVFNKFTDGNGNFRESLIGEIKGMLSLYEAAYFSKPQGDEILDRALAFVTTHLSSVAAATSSDNNSTTDPLVRKIVDALKLPLLKKSPMLETRRYFPIYEEDASHDKDLLKLAKLNFNHLQSLYKKELSDLVRWWKDLDTARKFPFTRNRIVELYLWSHGVMFEPQYQLSRNISAKVYALITLIDDTYDSYATYEEVKLFTAAVERWSFDQVDQLSENLKPLYCLLLNTFKEIEHDLATQGQSHRIHYAKRGMKGLIQGYFQEVKWLKNGHVPTMDEYMRNALLTSAYYIMPIAFVVGMEDLTVTKEALEWFENDTRILVAGSYLCRLINDIATHKRENIPTAVEFYMKEYNVSEKEAIDELNPQVDKAWKVHNEEIIHKPVPLNLLNVILNLSRNVVLTWMGMMSSLMLAQQQRKSSDYYSSIL